jgi:hypothetical protein
MTLARDQLMLDHHRRQAKQLPPLHTHLWGTRQIRATPQVPARLMPQPLVWAFDRANVDPE